jgi:hypothetical protein
MAEKQLTFDADVLFAEPSKKRSRELLGHLRGLAQHPGWAYIVQVLETQAERRYSHIGRNIPYTHEQVMEQAGLRGEAMSLELLTGLPATLIVEFERVLGIGPDDEENDE